MDQPKEQEDRPERLSRVVVAAPDAEWIKDLTDTLHRAGYIPHRTPSPETTTLAVTYRNPSAILIDASFIAAAGYRFFDSLRMTAPGVPVIVIADAEDEELRLKALMLGAEDCLIRPFAHQEAVIRIRRALERRGAMQNLARKKKEASSRAERDREDLQLLRAQLRRNVNLLQRAVDFHQRLLPDGDSANLHTQFLRHLSVQIGVDRLAYFSLRRPGATWLSASASWGLPQRLTEQLRIPAAGGLVSRLESGGVPLVVGSSGAIREIRLELGILAVGGFTACVPLLSRGTLVGLVAVGENRSGGPPDEDRLRLAQFLASALVPTLVAQENWSRERHVSAETLGFLVSSLEARNPYLQGHSLRVAQLAEDMGKRLGMTASELSGLTTSALLHDIGRFEVDAAFWSKQGPLAAADWKLIHRHPGEGARILSEAAWPEPVLNAVRHHHERWDGTGYPEGLRRQGIPWHARIVAVADALEALTSARPQRPAISWDEALVILRGEAGTHYDPVVVEATASASILKASA